MKKILAILSIAAASTASAQTTVALQHDRDFGSETKLSLAQKTSIGTFDAGVLTTRYPKFTAAGTDSTNGFDFGYSNGVTIGCLDITGRAGFGRLNNIDGNGGGFVGNTNYASLTGDLRWKIKDEFGIYLNARHRNSRGEGPNQNRLQGGVDMTVTKGIGARIGISHARQAGHKDTSLTATINYSF